MAQSWQAAALILWLLHVMERYANYVFMAANEI
jgi:hypothetical protein